MNSKHPPIPERAATADVDSWLFDQPDRPFQRQQTAFAATGFLGMCRHPYLSPDWIAHNNLWADSCNDLSKIIDPASAGGADAVITDRIRETYKSRGITPNSKF